MPLKKGTKQAVVSSNIKTLVDDWKKKGSIGSSHPATKKKAIKQAIAISLAKAGKSPRYDANHDLLGIVAITAAAPGDQQPCARRENRRHALSPGDGRRGRRLNRYRGHGG